MESVGLKEEDILDRTKWKNYIVDDSSSTATAMITALNTDPVYSRTKIDFACRNN